jgi:pilus assembly protein Flp/PilA
MAEISMLLEIIRHNVQRLRATMASEEGASAVEYGLIVSLIAAAIVTLVSTLGGRVATAFSKINAVLPSS